MTTPFPSLALPADADPPMRFGPTATINRAYSLLYQLAGTSFRANGAVTAEGDAAALGDAVRPNPRRFWSQGPSSLPMALAAQLSSLPRADVSLKIAEKRTENVQGSREGDGMQSSAEHALSRKHVQQAIRLAGEALEEDTRVQSPGTDVDFAVDLYFSSLDYLLTALQPSARITHRAKLFSALRRADPDATSSNNRTLLPPTNTPATTSIWAEPYNASSSAAAAPPWYNVRRWNPLAPPSRLRALHGRPDQQQHGSHVEADSDSDSGATLLWTTCECGRHVTLRVPAYLLKDRDAMKAANGRARTLSELFVAVLVWLAVAIKQSPIPYYVSLTLSTLFALFVTLNARLNLTQYALFALSYALERSVDLDKEFGIHRRVADWASVAFEACVRAAVAFARADGWTPPSPPSTGSRSSGDGSRGSSSSGAGALGVMLLDESQPRDRRAVTNSKMTDRSAFASSSAGDVAIRARANSGPSPPSTSTSTFGLTAISRKPASTSGSATPVPSQAQAHGGHAHSRSTSSAAGKPPPVVRVAAPLSPLRMSVSLPLLADGEARPHGAGSGAAGDDPSPPPYETAPVPPQVGGGWRASLRGSRL